MSRMTSRGVKCSPAVSFEISANLRISSSKTVPISVFEICFGVKVDAGELLGYLVEQAALGKPVNLGVEVEPLEDVADGGRERLDVAVEVLLDVVLIAHERLHVHRRGVVEALLGLAQEEGFRVNSG